MFILCSLRGLIIITIVLLKAGQLCAAEGNPIHPEDAAKRSLAILMQASQMSVASNGQPLDGTGNIEGRDIDIQLMTNFLQGSRQQSLKSVRDYFVSSVQDVYPEAPRATLEANFATVLQQALNQDPLTDIREFFKSLLFIRHIYQDLEPKPDIVEFTKRFRHHLNEPTTGIAKDESLYPDLKIKYDAFQFPAPQEIEAALAE